MANRYESLLQAIVGIIEEDYAGQPECASRNALEELLAVLSAAQQADALDDETFAACVAQYLAGFQDPLLHLEVSAEVRAPMVCGFSVRCFGDALYVTQAEEDERLHPGDALVALDGLGLGEHLQRAIGNPVNGEVCERQLWDDALLLCETMRVRRTDGTEEDLALRRFPKRGFVESLRAPSIEVLENVGLQAAERAVVIRAHHFVDGSVLKAMQEHFDDLAHADRVVIDVRDVEEGMIGNAFGLLALFFDRPVNLKDLMGQEFVYTRYTQLNAQLRMRQLSRMLAMSDASGKEWVQAEIDHVAACAGQGFVKEAEFEEDMAFPPAPENQQVFLLTDVRTKGAGERLVAIARQAAEQGCGKVRTVGRATCGSLDYSNMLSAPLDERFSLVYPMSKSEAAHLGKGMLGRGFEPDVQVTFTPEECTRDVVLEVALSV